MKKRVLRLLLCAFIVAIFTVNVGAINQAENDWQLAGHFTDSDQQFLESLGELPVYINNSSTFGVNGIGNEYQTSNTIYLDHLAEVTGLKFSYSYGTSIDEARSASIIFGFKQQAVYDFIGDYYSTAVYYEMDYHLLSNKNAASGAVSFAIMENAESEIFINENFPNSRITYYPDYSQCVSALNAGLADYALLTNDAYEILRVLSNFPNIKMEGMNVFSTDYRMYVPKSLDTRILEVLNRGITSIPKGDVSALISNAHSELFGTKSNMNNSILALSMVVLVIVVFVFIYILLSERKGANDRRYRIENSDTLTGAPNMNCFLSDGYEILNKYGKNLYSVMQINIRNFKYINDVYGVSEGDKMLKYLASSITKYLHENELMARVNADNFVVLLRQNELNSILAFFNELKLVMYKHVSITPDDMLGDIYCGIYIFDKDSDVDLKDAVDYSQFALRKASDKKQNYVVYEDKMRIDVEREAEIVRNMYDALRNNEFCFYLQPQHHLQKNNLVLSAEALVRWIKADGTVVFPGDFIPIFEKNGFIVEMDRYIFERVCRFVSSNLDTEWCRNIRYAVNVSRLDLYKRDFVEYYVSTKEKYGIPDGLLELEFTESVVFEDYNTFVHALSQLRANGFSCSLDDFGAGSSSLNVLKEIPVDILKMDRMFFIGDPEKMERNNSLIASVVAMARGLNLEIVAEGIEDEQQIEFLTKIGCDMIQGYVFAKPMPTSEFIEYVSKNRKYVLEAKPKEKPVEVDDTHNTLYSKYVSTLRYVNAMVCEIDIDADWIKVVSKSNGEYYMPLDEGRYSELFSRYIDEQVLPEFRDELRQISSAQNLLTCLIRGDENIRFEYKAKLFDKELNFFKEEDEWYAITFQRIDHQDGKNRQILAYIKSIEEKHNLSRQQWRFSLAVKSLHCALVELNVSTNKVVVIQNNLTNTRARMVKTGSLFEQFGLFVESFVHPKHRDMLLDAVSEVNINNFNNSDSEQLYYEYQVQTKDGTYIWNSATIMRSFDNKNVFLMMVQDISVKKIIEERLNDSQRQFGSLMNNLYKTVYEIDFQNNEISIIKTDGEFDENWDTNKTSYTTFRENISATMRVHPDYVKKLDEFLQTPYILNEFDNGNHQIVMELQLMGTSEYKWFSITIIKEKYAKDMAIAFLMDIDDSKRDSERAKSKGKQDPLTHTLTAGSFISGVTKIFSEDYLSATHLLLAIDICDMSKINKEAGVITGNLVVCNIAQKLKKLLGENALISRFGGDEFVVLIRDIDPMHSPDLIITDIIEGISRTEDDKNIINVGVSVGAAIYPDDDIDIGTLFKKLDIALTYAKRQSVNSFAMYTDTLLPRMQSSDAKFVLKENMSLQTKIRHSNVGMYFDDLTAGIFNALYETHNMEKTINEILSFVGTYFDVQRAYIYEIDLDGRHCKNTFEWCAHGVQKKMSELSHVDIPHFTGAENMDEYFAGSKIRVVSDAGELAPGFARLLKSMNCCSFIQVGVESGGRLIGLCGFDDCRSDREWTDEEKQILSFISRILGVFYLSNKSNNFLLRREILLQSVVDSLPIIEYIVDPETLELLYMNNTLHIARPNATLGMKCHKAFFDIDERCENCQIADLNPMMDTQEIVKKRYSSQPDGHEYECVTCAIEWDNPLGRAFAINALDITVMKQEESKV